MCEFVVDVCEILEPVAISRPMFELSRFTDESIAVPRQLDWPHKRTAPAVVGTKMLRREPSNREEGWPRITAGFGDSFHSSGRNNDNNYGGRDVEWSGGWARGAAADGSAHDEATSAVHQTTFAASRPVPAG